MQYTGTQTLKKYIQGETHGYAVRQTRTHTHQSIPQKYTQKEYWHSNRHKHTVLDERGPWPRDAHIYTLYIYTCVHTALRHMRTH